MPEEAGGQCMMGDVTLNKSNFGPLPQQIEAQDMGVEMISSFMTILWQPLLAKTKTTQFH